MKKVLLTIGLACGLAFSAAAYPGEHWNNVTIYIGGEKIQADVTDEGNLGYSAICHCPDGSTHKAWAVGQQSSLASAYWQWVDEFGE